MRRFYAHTMTCEEAGNKGSRKRFILTLSLLTRILYGEREISYDDKYKFDKEIVRLSFAGSDVIRDRLPRFLRGIEAVITPVSFIGNPLVDIKVTNKSYG